MEEAKETSQEQNTKAHQYFRNRQCGGKNEVVDMPEKYLHKTVKETSKCNVINFKLSVKMSMMCQMR